jgi:hypothetical protein
MVTFIHTERILKSSTAVQTYYYDRTKYYIIKTITMSQACIFYYSFQ